jgi:NitT/TauT family transport system ATP-binding protein/nitrate/nitrite transport system substrate-binding protein
MAGERVRLGMVRLTDAAPIVLAQVQGLFAAEGLDVRIEVEPSWANIADKLAWGLLDGAVMLPPLAIAMVLGLRGPATPLIVPAGVSLNGNAITVARPLAEAVLAAAPANARAAAEGLRRAMRNRLRLAVVHGFSTHDLLLRLFLLSGGIDPATDVAISIVPPAEMADALAAGSIDGFCAGAPWGAVAAASGAGQTIAGTSSVWPNHPECLAFNERWAEAHPAAVLALVRAVLRAGQECDRAENAPAIASMLSRPEWVGVPAPLIALSLPGGPAGAVDRSVFAAFAAGVPFAAHARWFVRAMACWREVPAGAAERAAAAYRTDLYAAAAMSLGFPAQPDAPPDTMPSLQASP